jgi:hypothetical protein
MQVADRLLAANFGGDGWGLTGNNTGGAGGGGRGSGYREVDGLVGSQDVSRGDTRPRRANVQRLGKLDKLGSGSIGTADENGNLELDSRRASRRRIVQPLPCL